MGIHPSPATIILFLYHTHSYIWAFVLAVPSSWNVLPYFWHSWCLLLIQVSAHVTPLQRGLGGLPRPSKTK